MTIQHIIKQENHNQTRKWHKIILLVNTDIPVRHNCLFVLFNCFFKVRTPFQSYYISKHIMPNFLVVVQNVFLAMLEKQRGYISLAFTSNLPDLTHLARSALILELYSALAFLLNPKRNHRNQTRKNLRALILCK